WADRGTGSDRCSTLQLGIWFKSHVLRQLNVYINPGSCRINDSNALAHPALGYATVQFGPERCELYPVVDTLNFHEIIGHICRAEEHTSELQSRFDLVCRLLLE